MKYADEYLYCLLSRRARDNFKCFKIDVVEAMQSVKGMRQMVVSAA